MRKASIALVLIAALGLTQCARADSVPDIAPVNEETPFIVVDQFGYRAGDMKIAVLRDPEVGFDAGRNYQPDTAYDVIDVLTGEVALTASPEPWDNAEIDPASGDRVWHLDFSELVATGTYLIRSRKGAVETGPFRVADDVYDPILREAFRTFFYQRAGYSKQPPFADARWSDSASHLGRRQDTEARLYSAKADASTTKDLRGGWYDAGDYNKYTNWTAEYCRTLLLSFTENPHAWGDDFGIPESGNGISDLLDEVQWGLDWLRRMQQDDGSVLSIVSLEPASPPSAARGASYYGPASTSASLSTAATFAYAAMVFGNSPAPGHLQYADDLRARAIHAWQWAAANPDITFYNNDPRFGSEGLGAGQQEVEPEFREGKRLAAAVYLFALTGDESYLDVVQAMIPQTQLVRDQRVDPYRLEAQDALMFYAQLPGAPEQTRSEILDAFRVAMEKAPYAISDTAQQGPYLSPIAEWHWGSNTIKSRTGNLLMDRMGLPQSAGMMIAAQTAAEGYVHYLHGVNPLGKVYLSNMADLGAENSVMEFYHAWFADGSPRWDRVGVSKFGPAPGFLVGGPNPTYSWDGCCPDNCGKSPEASTCSGVQLTPPFGQPPLKSYRDFNTSWPLNSWEVTENSNGYQVSYLRLLANFVD